MKDTSEKVHALKNVTEIKQDSLKKIINKTTMSLEKVVSKWPKSSCRLCSERNEGAKQRRIWQKLKSSYKKLNKILDGAETALDYARQDCFQLKESTHSTLEDIARNLGIDISFIETPYSANQGQDEEEEDFLDE